jgi:uncharacterized protein (DUF1015 family)
MAVVRPFSAIRYTRPANRDISALIAPPYDVLDQAGKDALAAKAPTNVVAIDLPHMPPKTPGPDAAYAKANDTLQAWLKDGTLVKDAYTAFYPYQQSYDYNGKTYHRRGFFALVRLSPFGAGEVVPHEKTYKGAIEDRLKLMRATTAQLSPVFGLFSDPDGEVNRLLYGNVSAPEAEGTLDGVVHRIWSVNDTATEEAVVKAMANKPVYIADGHHRYTTALQYQKEAIEKNGGPLPANHPANFCLFVLVPMQDPGLVIQATHRLIGGLDGFDIAAFKQIVAPHFDVINTPLRPDHVDELAETLPGYGKNSFGLFDGGTQKLHVLKLKNQDVLKPYEASQSDAWRRLDVAILQRYLIEEVLQPKFAAGREVTKGYTPDPKLVAPQVGAGKAYQVALLLQPTPLVALEDLGKTNEVMPQKSTYFYPKLATGFVIAPLA